MVWSSLGFTLAWMGAWRLGGEGWLVDDDGGLLLLLFTSSCAAVPCRCLVIQLHVVVSSGF